jgi:cystathionine gamma-synthase/methionine-gamma-lyase
MLEDLVAALEGAEAAVACASGMGATTALLFGLFERGDHVVAARDLYGITAKLLREVFTALGVSTHFVDTTDAATVKRAVEQHHPRAVICESLSNPLLKVSDVAALADIAHAEGAALVVDNTFGTPWLFQPLTLGADMVMHSATKYLGGHGDALGGVVAATGPWLKPLRTAATVVGAVLGPFEASMLSRGLKTLALRMERHNANAMALASWLDAHPMVERVFYPGLPSHPQHALAERQFGGRGYGGMVSFDLKDGNRERAGKFIDALCLALPGPTLGDVTTLVMYPAIASHRAFTPEQRAELGISDGLIRLSVGIENAEDIRTDLSRSLDRLADA